MGGGGEGGQRVLGHNLVWNRWGQVGAGVNRVVRHLNTPNCLFGVFPVLFPSPKAGKRAAGSQFGIIEMGGAS